MKITRRQLRGIIREAIAVGQRSDFETVYDAMWQFYVENQDLMLRFQEGRDPEGWKKVQAEEVAKYGWSWDEYIQEATAQVEEMERQMALSLQKAIETHPGHGDADGDGVLDFADADTSYNSDIS